MIVPEQREEVAPPEHGQRLSPALLQDEEGGEPLCCRVRGALLPPLRQGDPFLRFTLDAERELCPGAVSTPTTQTSGYLLGSTLLYGVHSDGSFGL